MTIDAAKAFITDVVDNAPVDTGLTVSSWKAGLNYHPTGTRIFEPGSLGSTAEFNKASVLANIYPIIERRVTGQTISFANETPYLTFINGGEYERYINSALEGVKTAVRQRKLL